MKDANGLRIDVIIFNAIRSPMKINVKIPIFATGEARPLNAS